MADQSVFQGMRPLLSVVIITRNEAARIAFAVESVLREVESYPGTEVVVVDSASTDATAEIATRYPVGVIRIPDTWFLSAAAGRYIGYLNTSGEFVLHLDGDMMLCPGWLAKAIPYMVANPQVAGCSGCWEDIYRQGGQVVHREMMNLNSDGRIAKVDEFGGAALYRRSALEKVGGFNPYIRSYEEPELCARLRHAGFELVRLPDQVSEHHSLPEHSLPNYWRRWKSRLWIGCGQMLRYHLGKDTFAQVVRLQGGFYLLSTFAALLGVLSLLLLGWALQSFWPVLLGVGGIVAFLALLFYRKRSISRVLLSLLLRVLILISGIEGFLISPRDPATYPTGAEIVQAMPPNSGIPG